MHNIAIEEALSLGELRENKNGKGYVVGTAQLQGVKFTLDGKEVIAPFVRVNILTQGRIVPAADYRPAQEAKLATQLNTLGEMADTAATPEALKAAEALVAKLRAKVSK